MRARLGLLISIATVVGVGPTGCARENPAFDEPIETQADDGTSTADDAADVPVDTGEEANPKLCELSGGMDMSIKVPQPCGETNDALGVYQHYFHVLEAAGSSWQVEFCTADCGECEPIPGQLTLAPLSVADIAGPGACLLVTGRRLGSGDDCDYHTLSVQDVGAGGRVSVLARRTQLLDLPSVDPVSGLANFDPGLVEVDSCDCNETPDSCCGGQTPTLYAYDLNGTVVGVGDSQAMMFNQGNYEFRAFDAFKPGDCDAPINVSWALVAQ